MLITDKFFTLFLLASNISFQDLNQEKVLIVDERDSIDITALAFYPIAQGLIT